MSRYSFGYSSTVRLFWLWGIKGFEVAARNNFDYLPQEEIEAVTAILIDDKNIDMIMISLFIFSYLNISLISIFWSISIFSGISIRNVPSFSL